jgi:hypothetical protein
MLKIFSRFEMLSVFISFILLLIFLSYYAFKNRKDIFMIIKKLNRWDYVLIIILVILRLFSFFYLGVFEDPMSGSNAQNWSYKCQGRIFVSNVSFFDKSEQIVKCHSAHALLFGLNLGLLYFITGSFSSLNGIVLNLVLSVINSVIIYIFLVSAHNGNFKKAFGFVCSLGFLFIPLLFFESLYSSVQYFGAIFVLMFYVLFYVFLRKYDIDNKLDVDLLIILFLVVSCMLNVKFEYVFSAFSGWLIILIFMLKRMGLKKIFRVIIGQKRLVDKKERDFLRFFIVLSIFVLVMNLHVLTRSQNKDAVPRDPFGLKEVERNFGYMFLGDFSALQINSILLTFVLGSVFFLKKSIVKMFYYYGYIFTMLFYFSFSAFHTFSMGYIFVIMISFIVPFLIFHKNNFTKLFFLFILVLAFGLFIGDYSYDFVKESTPKDCVGDLTEIYPAKDIFVGGWVYFDEQLLLGIHDSNLKNIGYDRLSIRTLKGKYYFWYYMGYEIDLRTFRDCEDVQFIPNSCFNMNSRFFFKKC